MSPQFLISLSSLNSKKNQTDENKRNETSRRLDLQERCHGIPELQNHTDESILKRLCDEFKNRTNWSKGIYHFKQLNTGIGAK